MDIRLNSKQRFRVVTGYSKNNWIDITCGDFEQSLEVSFLSSQQYLEIRKKEGQICSFYFESKRQKKDYDFGWWIDAEVVFSNNDVKHK